MALISCFKCLSDNDIHLEGTAPDGTRILRCGECGHTWTPKVATTAPALTRSPFEMAKGRFATSAMVEPGLMARVARLKKQYLKTDAPAEEWRWRAGERLQGWIELQYRWGVAW